MLFFLTSFFINFLFIFASLLLFLLFLIFCLQNAMLIILTLVVVFLVSCFLFIFLEAYYLSLVFIIVYVGAIAILFLFVIMLTNKLYLVIPSFWLLCCQFIGVLIGLELFWYFGSLTVLLDSFWFFLTVPDLFFTDPFSRVLFLAEPILVFGRTLYGIFPIYVVLLGLLLVVVLVGIVVLLRGTSTNILVVSRSVDFSPVSYKNLWQVSDFITYKN